MSCVIFLCNHGIAVLFQAFRYFITVVGVDVDVSMTTFSL